MSDADAPPTVDRTLSTRFMGLTAAVPLVMLVSGVAWATLMNRLYPNWYYAAHADRVPPPFLASTATDAAGAILLVGAISTIGFAIRKGQGWLALLFGGYFALVFLATCVAMFLVSSGGVVP